MKYLKNKRKELLKVYLFSLVFIIILFFLFWKNLDLFLKFYDLRGKNEQLDEKIKLEGKRVAKTEQDIAKLQTPIGQDEIILKKFSRQKPGEKVIEILE